MKRLNQRELISSVDSSTGMSDASSVKYRCPECKQLYSSTSALKVHLKSHTGELAFRCHHCGRHFEREEERLAHIRQLHASRPNIKGQSMTSTPKGAGPRLTVPAAVPTTSTSARAAANEKEKKKGRHSTSSTRAGALVHLDA